MDLYNITTKIPYIIMLIVGLTVILGLYIGGLNNLSMEIDSSAQQEYRKAIVLEHLLNIDASENELEETSGEGYYYDRTRARIPIEYFTNENPANDEIGYRKNGDNCYISQVPGLDGDKFAFSIDSPERMFFDTLSTNPDFQAFSEDCLISRPNSASSPALLIRESEDKSPLEVIIYVYPV